MSIESLRYELQDALGAQVPDKTWDYLKQRYVPLYLKRKIRFERLVEETRALKDLSGEPAPEGPVLTAPLSQGRPRAVRQEAISSILAEDAALNPEVVAFREKFLGGKTISFDRVKEWIKAQAEKDGEPSQWLRIPLPERHTLSGPQGWAIDPPLTMSSLQDTAFGLSRSVLEYAVPNSEYVKHELTAADGVLETLRVLSERLADKYSWNPAWATVFVLTGETPPAFAVTVQMRRKTIVSASRIVLTIDPTIDPKDLASFYRRVRREFLGRRHRTLSEKHVRLAEFAFSRPEEKWGKRMAAWNRKWNKQHPDWKYDSEKNFTRDCHQAVRRLLGQEVKLNGKTKRKPRR